MGSAVQSSPLTTPLTMRAFLTVFLAVSVCGEADPYTIGQVLAGATNGGVITGVSYPGLGQWLASLTPPTITLFTPGSITTSERGRQKPRPNLSRIPSDRSWLVRPLEVSSPVLPTVTA